MNFRLLPFLLLALLAGCSTVDKRIQEKSALFNGLDAATQEKLRQGIVEIGFTTDMVYIALGEPDDKREKLSATGRELTWVYSSYKQEYAGTGVAGHRRVLIYDPALKRSYVMLEPVVVDVYNQRIDDRIRVTFREGKVTVIEQVKE